MQQLAIIVSYASAAVGVFFALFTFINGGLGRHSVLAAFAMVLLALWAITLAISFGITEEDTFILVGVAVYTVSLLMQYCFMILSSSFTTIKNKQFWIMNAVTLVPALCLISAMLYNSTAMFLGVDFSGNKILPLVIQNEVGYTLFALLILLYSVLSVFFLIQAIKQAKTKSGRGALKVMLIGVIIAFTSGVIFNLAIPMFLHDYSWSWVGPLSILVLAAGSYRAVVKYAQDEL